MFLDTRFGVKESKMLQAIYQNYLKENDEVKLLYQKQVFNYYFELNDRNIIWTEIELREDLQLLIEAEKFEHCAIINDILKGFE